MLSPTMQPSSRQNPESCWVGLFLFSCFQHALLIIFENGLPACPICRSHCCRPYFSVDGDELEFPGSENVVNLSPRYGDWDSDPRYKFSYSENFQRHGKTLVSVNRPSIFRLFRSEETVVSVFISGLRAFSSSGMFSVKATLFSKNINSITFSI